MQVPAIREDPWTYMNQITGSQSRGQAQTETHHLIKRGLARLCGCAIVKADNSQEVQEQPWCKACMTNAEKDGNCATTKHASVKMQHWRKG